MENREILVANTRTQKRKKITTNATTLGELKEALTANDVDFTGMDFTEGITKTLLLDDSTPLPKDVMYKGNQTNNLVILLTNTRKNISSGAEDRQTAYEIIKEHDLQEGIKYEFGRNYTQVATTDLWEYIYANTDEGYDEDADNSEEDNDEDDILENTTFEKEEPTINSMVVAPIYDLVKALATKDVLSASDLIAIADMIKELASRIEEGNYLTTSDGAITGDDVDEMLAEIASI